MNGLSFFSKAQWAPVDEKIRSPTSSAEKGFLMSKGKIILECSLDKEIYYHGQEIPINVAVHNNSNKSVKSIRVGANSNYIHQSSLKHLRVLIGGHYSAL